MEKTELTAQQEMMEIPAEKMAEIKDHIVKSQSVLELVADSLEEKLQPEGSDITTELNALTTIYDQLDHAYQDAEDVEAFLKQTEAVDKKNA